MIRPILSNTFRKETTIIFPLLLLVFQAVYSTAVADHETDEADPPIELNPIELNPADYVPLEVGNRWTYKHSYLNLSYEIGGRRNPKAYEIPGYPYGGGNPLPPDSLTWVERTLTIEITHTVIIDGLEYYVLSGADYDWPPLHDFFWGGKKVRLSDEGVLVFRWNGQDLPLYDLRSDYEPTAILIPGFPRSPRHEHPKTEVHRSTDNSKPLDGGPTLRFSFGYPDNTPRGWSIEFLPGYGVGGCELKGLPPTGSIIVLWNEFQPVSATISGEEISYEQLTRVDPPPPRPPRAGAHRDTLGIGKGYDFSSRSSGYYLSTGAFYVNQFTYSHTASAFPPFIEAGRGLRDLHPADFDSLISEGIPVDLRRERQNFVHPSPSTGDTLYYWRTARLHEGHTYAVWTREGGVGLLSVVEIITSRDPAFREFVSRVVFDWIYDPRGSSFTEVEATVLGATVRGLTVEFARAVACRRPHYAWCTFTDRDGWLQLSIAGDGVSGYYRARALSADGEVVGKWNSIPLNRNRRQVLELTLGGGARVVAVEAPEAAKAVAAAEEAAVGGLLPNAPNPFNAGTLIPYRVATPGPVRLEIYNVLGQPVRTLVNEFRPAGAYQVFWDARDGEGTQVGAGVYFARLRHPEGMQTRRLLYLK